MDSRAVVDAHPPGAGGKDHAPVALRPADERFVVAGVEPAVAGHLASRRFPVASGAEARIDGAESVVVMKVGRHLTKIRNVIADLGLLETAMYVERATLADERVMPLAEAPKKAPYFSMILITKGADPWL